jgi:hypothetical protein
VTFALASSVTNAKAEMPVAPILAGARCSDCSAGAPADVVLARVAAIVALPDIVAGNVSTPLMPLAIVGKATLLDALDETPAEVLSLAGATDGDGAGATDGARVGVAIGCGCDPPPPPPPHAASPAATHIAMPSHGKRPILTRESPISSLIRAV